jgi:hypothetical protein
MAHARRKFIEAKTAQGKSKTGKADVMLNLIGKLYGIEVVKSKKSGHFSGIIVKHFLGAKLSSKSFAMEKRNYLNLCSLIQLSVALGVIPSKTF